MRLEYYRKGLNSIFGVTDDFQKFHQSFSIVKDTIKFLWNRNCEDVVLTIDGIDVTLTPNQVITVTYLQNLSFKKTNYPITGILFNREFYCIVDHDSEVSCNGILFFGTQDLPIINIPKVQLKRFNLLFEILIEEFLTPDNIQGDMLQMLLKRFIIMNTRLAKQQLVVKSLDNKQIEIIRKFNFLVDMHYKTKRKVSDYAEMLFKSPKTLSNLFSIYNQKSPQQIILDRLALEAKRLLQFTAKQNQEIAFELGFNDPTHFSKFFKKMTKMTPSEYRDNLLFE